MIDRRNVSNLYPLSPLQEGMLYHALREPLSRAYFEQIDFEIPGPLDATAYLEAWQELVGRHDILRTVFAIRKLEQPLQVVLRNQPLVVLRQDLQALDAEEAESLVAAHRTQDLEQGFDLTASVPMRLALFAMPGARHRVVWSFHHILLDGWSLAILQSDLEEFYQARLAGRSPRLPPAAPYSAYIKWLGRRDRKQGLLFWQSRLQGLELATPVPRRLDARFAVPAVDLGRGECLHPLGAAANQALREVAASQGVTANLVVQSIWGLLLGRRNGRRDIAFAATVAGRPAEVEGAERTVGLFINAVGVRVRWSRDESYAGLLARLHAESLEARLHHDCPLADVQAGHPLGQGLFDHILVFENYPQLERGPQQEAHVASLHEYTHYAFEFQFLPGQPSKLRLRFDATFFDAASVALLARDFEALLLAAAADPQQPAETLVWPQTGWKAPARIAIAASFTADPIAHSLARWLSQLACPSEVQLAPYNQCLQQLADPQSVLAGAEFGVLLLRFTDAARDLGALDEAEARRRLDAHFELLLALLRQRGPKPLTVALLPCAAMDGPRAAHVLALEERWREALSSLQPAIALMDLRDLGAAHGLDEVFDFAADRAGHLPFSTGGCDAIAGRIARAVHVHSRPPFKVLAVDCDNTLWGGVAGEAGPLGVEIGTGHLALQRRLIELQASGFLLTLVSKNREEDVWAVFDTRPDMLLRREHLAAWAINWQPKSSSLRQLAARLNVGVDSMVLIDDNPLECAEVMHNCPEALAIVLPPEPDLNGAWLSQIWAFDRVHVTDEDRARTSMVAVEMQRQAVLATTSTPDLLSQLEIQVRVGPVQPHQLARVAQLTQRTNQFNLSGKRRDEAQLAALLLQPAVEVLAVEVEDRYGAYGLTGVAVVQRRDRTLAIDTLLLSCRVLGRQVEFALLAALARRAQAHDCTSVEAQLLATERNEPVRLFLACAPWKPLGDGLFCCDAAAVSAPADVALVAEHVFLPAPAAPGAVAVFPLAPPAATGLPAAGEAARFPAAYPMPLSNEARLWHAVQYLPLLAACAGWPGTRPVSAAFGAPARGRSPATDAERAIAAIWAEVLGREVGDAQAGFATLGGHSLHAVRVVSRLERRFGRPIGLQEFFENDTIVALAAWFEGRSAGHGSAPLAPVPRAADASDYPLSPNQQRLWLLGQMGDARNVHNLCAAFRLRGAIDAAAMHRAMQRLVERHEALRTVIGLRDDQPRQRVLEALPDAFTVHAPEPGRSEETLRAHITGRSRLSFQLEGGPLFHADLHCLGERDHVLALHLHHIISDGWSFGLLLDDLAGFYEQERDGAATPRAAIGLRHRDFAAWTRSADCEATLGADSDYWRRRLLPLETIARIPADFATPSGPMAQAAVAMRTLATSASAIQAWCVQQRVTQFSLLAALVAVLVSRCGGEPAVRLGMPTAGRTRPELEDIVGFFANTTVLAAQVRPEQSFSALLSQLQRDVSDALAHQGLPFDRLVADLQPARETGRNALFDVLVVLQNARGKSKTLPGVEVSEFPVDTGLTEFDLVFEFGETQDNRLACVLRYRSGRYRRETAELLLDRLEALMQGALARADTPVQELPLIGPRERGLLAAMAEGGVSEIPNATIPQLFAAQAARSPRAIAVAQGADALDYEALDQRANSLAHVLRREHDVHPGDTVAVLLDRRVDWAVALLGVMKAGAIYLPLDPQHPPARLRRLLERSASKTLIASRPAHSVADGLAVRALEPLAATQREPAPPAVPTSPEDAAYLIFTSGSTGEPKGVRVQHRAFVNMILAQIRGFGITPEDTVLQIASCAFDASLSEFFMAWLCGARAAIADHEVTRDGALLAQEIRRQHATVATLTPSHLRQLEDTQLTGLRTVVLAAEAVLAQDARRLKALGMQVFNAYGPTETAVCATLMRVDAVPDGAAPVAIGRPLANLHVRISHGHAGDAPIGVPGEIIVGGAGVALGYLAGAHTHRDTSFSCDADGRRTYHTGDLGRWLHDGTIEYVGRKDAQLKIRGHRVEPGEVVAALAALQGVREAGVVVMQSPSGAYLAACLCGERQPDSLLRARLSAQLPPHLLPSRYTWLDTMPLTSSGKLDRAALEAACLATPAPSESAVSLSPDESLLLAIWRHCLPGEVDVDTDFFEAGGDSLAAMHAARKIAAALGRPCNALQFFRTPTVRGMAAALDAGVPLARVSSLGAGADAVFALPPYPGLEAGYGLLAQALPEATVHVLPFTDQPLDELIGLYVRAVEDLAPAGRAVLVGYSGGGKLALALAHALSAHERPVAAVVLIDAWDASEATEEARRQMDAAMLEQLPEAAGAGLAALYRSRVGALHPRGAIAAPLYHLLAGDVSPAAAQGFSRDWRAIAGAGYVEHELAGSHHQLLDRARVGAAAGHLRGILRQVRQGPVGGAPAIGRPAMPATATSTRS